MNLSGLFKGRVSVVCVGSELSGDDALGRKLAGLLAGLKDPDLQILYTSTAPENFLDELIMFKPKRVVVVDAGDFGGRPGEIRQLDPADLQSAHISTHRAPMKMFTARLAGENIPTTYIAVQAKQTGLGEPMSAEVREAAVKLACRIREARGRWKRRAG